MLTKAHEFRIQGLGSLAPAYPLRSEVKCLGSRALDVLLEIEDAGGFQK